MKTFLLVAFAGVLLTIAENKALAFDDETTKKGAACALADQLCQEIDNNKIVVDKVADALEKLGKEAGEVLAETVRKGFNLAGSPDDGEKRKRLHFAKRAAQILGEIGDDVAGLAVVVRTLASAGATPLAGECEQEVRRAHLEAREAAIEALGKIYKQNERLAAKAEMVKAIQALKDALSQAKPVVLFWFYQYALKRTPDIQKVEEAWKKAVNSGSEAEDAVDKWVQAEERGSDSDALKSAKDVKKGVRELRAELDEGVEGINQLKNARRTYAEIPPWEWRMSSGIQTGLAGMNAALSWLHAVLNLIKVDLALDSLQQREGVIEANQMVLNKDMAINSLNGLVGDKCFAIKIRAAEALSLIYGKLQNRVRNKPSSSSLLETLRSWLCR